MQAQHPSGSAVKATTAPRHLLATAIVGAALINYQIAKTPDARAHLEQLASQTELTARDAAVVAQLLARPVNTTTLN
jgi:hypothetical protein